MDQQVSQLSDRCIRLEQLYLAQRAELTEIKKWCAAFERENAESKKKRSLMEKIHPLPIYYHNGVLHKNITNKRFRCGVCNREGYEGNKKRNVMCPYAKNSPAPHYRIICPTPSREVDAVPCAKHSRMNRTVERGIMIVKGARILSLKESERGKI